MNEQQVETATLRLVGWHEENSALSERSGGFGTASQLISVVCLLVPEVMAVGEAVETDGVPFVHMVCAGALYSVGLRMSEGPTRATLRSRSLGNTGTLVAYGVSSAGPTAGYVTRWAFGVPNMPTLQTTEGDDSNDVFRSGLGGRIFASPASFDPNEEVGRAIAAQFGWVRTDLLPPFGRR